MDINRTIFNFNFFDISKNKTALGVDGDCAKRRFRPKSAIISKNTNTKKKYFLDSL